MESIPIGLLDRQRVKAKTASYDPEITVYCIWILYLDITDKNGKNNRKIVSIIRFNEVALYYYLGDSISDSSVLHPKQMGRLGGYR